MRNTISFVIFEKLKIGSLVYFRYIFLCLLLLAPLYTVSCTAPVTPPSQKTRLILTPFLQKGFGTGQRPVIVVAQLRGRLGLDQCIFFQMQYADSNAIRLFFYEGKEIKQDFSDYTTQEIAKCQQFGISCLFGTVSRKNPEFSLQVDMTGKAGGLLVAKLLDKDCKKETDSISLQTLAIGNSFFRDENAGTQASEQSNADAGGE